MTRRRRERGRRIEVGRRRHLVHGFFLTHFFRPAGRRTLRPLRTFRRLPGIGPLTFAAGFSLISYLACLYAPRLTIIIIRVRELLFSSRLHTRRDWLNS